jgi:hypothetical protein
MTEHQIDNIMFVKYSNFHVSNRQCFSRGCIIDFPPFLFSLCANDINFQFIKYSNFHDSNRQCNHIFKSNILKFKFKHTCSPNKLKLTCKIMKKSIFHEVATKVLQDPREADHVCLDISMYLKKLFNVTFIPFEPNLFPTYS